jgi:hypothetical protein
MFSWIRRRCSYANVVATLALFFAMTGGALAASHYLITSTKQIKPSVLSALKGKAGPAGANGAAGAAGIAGAQGPQGPAGAKGETGATGSQGPEGKEGKAGKNGTNGTTGFTEVLPAGKTETGTWAFGFALTEGTAAYAEHSAMIPLSFNVPLKDALERNDVHFVGEDSMQCVESEEPGREACEATKKRVEQADAESEATCPGSAEDPKADPGNLCVYTTFGSSAGAGRALFGLVANAGSSALPSNVGSATTGALLYLDFLTEGDVGGGGTALTTVAAYGTWAVTAAD